ncbi:MAG TPA: 4-hydroxy-tetrahydrodipicolinate reductase [Jatrophihabitans sp.]|nr:4-hydroxy-tetrahydrodipicolinate reductase [Jatrophihabitans sp.]
MTDTATGNGNLQSNIRVVVAGANGKMGKVMAAGLPHHQGIEVVGRLHRDDPNTSALLADADVLVDFTIAHAAVPLLLTAIEAGVRPVSGTSGLSDEALQAVDDAARDKGIPAIWASQFTLGGALMMHFCRLAAHYMESATVLEAHHATKADAPSGTAWELARQIRAAHGEDLVDHPSEHETVSEVRGGLEGGVRIHAIRLPAILGWNEVTFAGGGEVLTVRQTDVSRDAFVPFVARAVHEVVQTDRVGLIRGFGDVIGLEQDRQDVRVAAAAAATGA